MKGGPPGVALKTIDITEIQAKILAQDAFITMYSPVNYTIALHVPLLHLDYIFVIVSVIKKQLRFLRQRFH